MRALLSTGILVTITIAVFVCAFFLNFSSPTLPAGDDGSLRSPNPAPSSSSSEQRILAFEEPEMDLGAAKGTVSHRVSYRNTGVEPLEIKKVWGSCSCMISTPDHSILQPGETGTVTLEADLSHKEPGSHRFLLFIEYLYAGSTATATAGLHVAHQPDLYITPNLLEMVVTEGGLSMGSVTIIDYRKESLQVLKVRTSSSAIKTKISERPSEYLPGWRHLIEVVYTDPPNEKRPEIRERIFIDTSAPQTPSLKVDVNVRRLDRMRIAPQTIALHPDVPANVILRDSLGAKVIVAECETAGLAVPSFRREGESAKKVSFSLPRGAVDSSKYPATIWIRVSEPCARRLPLTVSLASRKRS